jgi:hypothetical protein
LLAGRGTVDGNPAAYVCEAYTCRAPVTDPDALAAALDEAVAARRTAPGDAAAPGTLRDGDPDR